ncbi:MAG TPA: hypothetical protein VKJ07_00515, partial [Mycobacteriales bacterium]|nr:hypothetical protein [Mycobacteriales bacterium]
PTVTHHYASAPVHHTTQQIVASHPAAKPVHRAAATPAATPAAVLKARLSKLRTAAAAAQSADPVTQAFDFLTNVTTLSS